MGPEPGEQRSVWVVLLPFEDQGVRAELLAGTEVLSGQDVDVKAA